MKPPSYVVALEESFRRGLPVPPIRLTNRGEYDLHDGNHRLTAARRAAVTHILERVMSEADYFHYARGINERAKLRKQKAAMRLALQRHADGRARLTAKTRLSCERFLQATE